MKNKLTAAHEKRAEQAILKPFRYEGKITNWKEMIDGKEFCRAEIAQVPSVKWNRVKFNRMGWAEQEDYERKMSITKPEYRLYFPDGAFLEAPKSAYDYYELATLSVEYNRLIQ